MLNLFTLHVKAEFEAINSAERNRRKNTMNTDTMKRKIMFAWITEEELNWLMILNELEESAEEFEIESIGEGLDKLMENMNNKDIRLRDEALYGLQEEGLIQMDAEPFAGDLNCIDVEIKQRGRKVLKEAKCILEEKNSELPELELSLIEMKKKEAFKEKVKEKAIDGLMDFAKTAATIVFQRVFFGV
ncbi:MAG: hypothetical protein ACI4FZ_11825 [Lachnospiraceae bacterium]